MENTVGCTGTVVYNQFRKTENRFRVDKGIHFKNLREKVPYIIKVNLAKNTYQTQPSWWPGQSVWVSNPF